MSCEGDEEKKEKKEKRKKNRMGHDLTHGSTWVKIVTKSSYNMLIDEFIANLLYQWNPRTGVKSLLAPLFCFPSYSLLILLLFLSFLISHLL